MKVFFGNQKVSNKISNMVFLKIYNLNKERELKNYKPEIFFEKLSQLLTEINRNFEIIKYVFFLHSNLLKEAFHRNIRWMYEEEAYKLEFGKNPLESYAIWKSNEEKKNVLTTKDFENYGYYQILGEKGDNM